MSAQYPPMARQKRTDSFRAAHHMQKLESRRALLRSRIQQCKRRAQAAHTELNLALAYEHRVAQRFGPALVSDLCVWAVFGFIIRAGLAMLDRLLVLRAITQAVGA